VQTCAAGLIAVANSICGAGATDADADDDDDSSEAVPLSSVGAAVTLTKSESAWWSKYQSRYMRRMNEYAYRKHGYEYESRANKTAKYQQLST
jgi:hypothetical protein